MQTAFLYFDEFIHIPTDDRNEKFVLGALIALKSSRFRIKPRSSTRFNRLFSFTVYQYDALRVKTFLKLTRMLGNGTNKYKNSHTIYRM